MKLDEIFRLAAKGRINRREFVQLAMAAGLAAGTAETLFSRAAHADPKKGGRFRMALGHGSTTDTLDPATYVNNYTGTFGWGT
jgi:peptide/nickel transport system substrate-binding protein